MTKRRLSFNFVDILLLLLVGAVGFLLLYVFVLSDRSAGSTAEQQVKIEYVVEIQNADARFADAVKTGDTVYDGVENKFLGTVTGVQAYPFKKNVVDYSNKTEREAAVKDRIVLSVTIAAQADSSDYAFSVNNIDIRVGTQYSLNFPDFYGVGYCVNLEEAH